MGTGQFRLGLTGGSTDHRGADGLCPLTSDQANAAGSGVDQHGIARLHTVGTAQQVSTGQPLQHHRRSGTEIDGCRQLQEPIGWHVTRLAVGANRAARIGDTVARHDIAHPLADGLDHPGAFKADAGRQRQRIQTGPMISINKVQADRFVAHTGLTRRGCADIDSLPVQHFRPTSFMKSDCLHHHRSPMRNLLPPGGTEYGQPEKRKA